MTLRFNRIEPGWYASEDGQYAVVRDGYQPGVYGDEGITGGEWAACFDPRGRLRDDHNAGENLEWFATKREAVDHLTQITRTD